jgi:hypothetical protein
MYVDSIRIGIDCKTAYVGDGTKGITILDVSDPYNFKVINSVSLNGWAFRIIPFNNDNIAFVAQNDNNELTLLDIRDKKNIFIIQTY